MEKIVTWYGQDVRELSREELLDVVQFMAEDMERLRESRRREWEMFALFEKTRHQRNLAALGQG